MKRTTVAIVNVYRSPGRLSRGRLVVGNVIFPCGLGRSGTRHLKREGDGATPNGRFLFGRAYFRADRAPRYRSLLRLRVLKPTDAWCDDPADRRYNRPIERRATTAAAGDETMWRADHLYDVVIEIAYNTRPRVRGRGSAIFLHLARPQFAPTAGCIALRASDMRKLLGMIGPRTKIAIGRSQCPL